MVPKNSRSSGVRSSRQKAATATPSSALRVTSCPALREASCGLRAPRNWLVTTAPPVASAAKTLMMRLLIISTSETPEMAASPTLETMTVSDMPTSAARVCSMTSGQSSRSRSRLANSGALPRGGAVWVCTASSNGNSPLPGRPGCGASFISSQQYTTPGRKTKARRVLAGGQIFCRFPSFPAGWSAPPGCGRLPPAGWRRPPRSGRRWSGWWSFSRCHSCRRRSSGPAGLWLDFVFLCRKFTVLPGSRPGPGGRGAGPPSCGASTRRSAPGW